MLYLMALTCRLLVEEPISTRALQNRLTRAEIWVMSSRSKLKLWIFKNPEWFESERVKVGQNLLG
jgi:hypothetical protein